MAISRLSTSRVTQGLPKYQSAWDNDTAQGALEPIGSTLCNGTSASVNFSNVPQHYKHLMVVVYGRSSYTGTFTTYSVYLNNATYALTSYIAVSGDGANMSTGRAVNGSYGATPQIPGVSAPANFYGASTTYIPNYTEASNKLMMTKYVNSLNQSGGIIQGLISTLYRDTNPVTFLSIATNGSFVAGSCVTLYGIKAGA
jgi:hypothetical protein